MATRYISRIIKVGELALGGHLPVRVQSMTNTDTNDTDATVAQTVRLAEAGCEMVRITAQGIREAENLALIRKSLHSKGIRIPLAADIHFNPAAAETAARIVEKVRINPGNYSDKRENTFVYTAKAYEEELERIAARLRPLLAICKQYGTAVRIGTNHGSLSGRIMSRYGDTAEGMVESALEFGRICVAEGFYNLVFSMKSSNVKVMVESTRLLAQKMAEENMFFPLHLGVTEAGDGEDGIIKSAAGIGALLEQGIGDTIRVSLTGAPEPEIPVAKAIASRYDARRKDLSLKLPEALNKPGARDETIAAGGIGGHNLVRVIAEKGEMPCLVDEKFIAEGVLSGHDLEKLFVAEGNAAAMIAALNKTNAAERMPVVLKNTYATSDLLRFRVDSAIDMGSLLLEGAGNAVWIEAPAFEPEVVNATAFAILQATRTRITRTDYIACPSCGRTLFDIEEVLQQVKAATSHLTNLKIAVMGCIVNGPGEMADADYGYVGAGRGKVTLYKGKEVMLRSIPAEEAIKALVDLIKQSGDWREQEESGG